MQQKKKEKETALCLFVSKVHCKDVDMFYFSHYFHLSTLSEKYACVDSHGNNR